MKVRVHEDEGDKIGDPTERTRSQVVTAIENGKTFVTILQGGKWKKGQDVHIITVKGTKYLRTDQNLKASDNLGELPEF